MLRFLLTQKQGKFFFNPPPHLKQVQLNTIQNLVSIQLQLNAKPGSIMLLTQL